MTKNQMKLMAEAKRRASTNLGLYYKYGAFEENPVQVENRILHRNRQMKINNGLIKTLKY